MFLALGHGVLKQSQVGAEIVQDSACSPSPSVIGIKPDETCLTVQGPIRYVSLWR